jgi:hypothetical protein
MELQGAHGKAPEKTTVRSVMRALTGFFAGAKGGAGTTARTARLLAMKTLILVPALILAATAAYAGAASPSLAAEEASATRSQTMRVVRVTTPATKATDCNSATWPNIPVACLEREPATADTTLSLNN